MRWTSITTATRRLSTAFGLAVCALVAAGQAGVPAAAEGPARPNILWLTCEDMSPIIGPYGDRYATTPNLDRFATRALRYRHAWSNAPVCAPARTTLISGLYPPCTGTENMRSMDRLPAGFKLYPQLLRDAGYYCTNNSKTDYNLAEPGKVWDESSARAHWKSRPAGQPFFAVFNFTITHESQVRNRKHPLVHDPAKAPLPSYYPDTPEIRRDVAHYYDNVTTMDAEVGEKLKELEAAGLADDTIVFFYSDHGTGLPRGKRTPCNSGLQVPLLIHVPEKFRALAPKDYAPGGTTERLVSFVDFAPTLLSVAGVQPPSYQQGHAFMGKYDTPPQPYLYGFRGRMDERVDLVRSVRDARYVYVRNYLPHRPHGQHVAYQFETDTTRIWKELFDAGKLKAPQTYFWEPRAGEELYDLQSDPDEVKNLAKSPEHREVLERLRAAQQTLAREIRDVGFVPEGEVKSRSAGLTPYEMGHDRTKYDFDRVLLFANLASSDQRQPQRMFKDGLRDTDSAVRYWSATGILIRGTAAVKDSKKELLDALGNTSPYVRAVAAEALGRYGDEADLQKALPVLAELAAGGQGMFAALTALTAIDELGAKAAPILPALKAIDPKDAAAPQRYAGYVPRLLEKVLAALQQ
jgi:uncharacterized sulfatase